MNHLRRTILLLALALLVAACAGGAPTAGSTAGAPSPSADASVDLAHIVLDADAPPPGTTNDATVEGAPVLTRPVVSDRATEFLALDGFSDGRYTEFSGDGGLFLSLALLFDDDESAEQALDLYLDELQSDVGYGVGTGRLEPGLGAGATCGEFDNPALGGVHENACVWRNGAVVLIAGGTLEPDVVVSFAEGMDARATSEQ